MKVAFLLIAALFPFVTWSQEEESSAALSRVWTSSEIVLSVALLLFTFLLVVLESIIVVKAKTPWSPQSILRIVGLTLIIGISAFLVVAGYDQDQITPVTGLLGVIAGYLLGANQTKNAA